MRKAKWFLAVTMLAMGLFSTTALGITYNVTQDRLNSSYIVTKNGDTSSFMARGTTGTGAYCRTRLEWLNDTLHKEQYPDYD